MSTAPPVIPIRTEADACAVLARLGTPVSSLMSGWVDGELWIGERCFRCDGRGHLGGGRGLGPWQTCFRCAGSRARWRRVKAYARLARTRARRLAQRAAREASEAPQRAEQAARRNEEALAAKLDGQRRWCEANGHGAVTFAELDAKRQAEREATAHVGALGERTELVATVVAVVELPSRYGRRLLFVMEDPEGNSLTWRTAGGLRVPEPGDDCDGEEYHSPPSRGACAGDKFRLRATIKGHGEYRGAPQTELSRCKVLGVLDAAGGAT